MSKVALVIEDTPANRDFFERLLTQAGFDVRCASTGKMALELASTMSDLALAVVDMEMPDMSGLNITKHLGKKFPQAYKIVATMHDERTLMKSAFDKGCNLFIVKPHGFMELFQLLTQHDVDTLSGRPAHVLDQFGLRPFLTAESA